MQAGKPLFWSKLATMRASDAWKRGPSKGYEEGPGGSRKARNSRKRGLVLIIENFRGKLCPILRADSAKFNDRPRQGEG